MELAGLIREEAAITDTLADVAAADEEGWISSSWLSSLLAQAKEQGVELVGPDGLLNQLTKRVLENGPGLD